MYRDPSFVRIAQLEARLAELEAQRSWVRARANRLTTRRRSRLRRQLAVATGVLLGAAAGAVVIFPLALSRCGGPGPRQQAHVDVRTLHAVVSHWRAEHGPADCPTFRQLVEEKEVSSRSRGEDPWDRPYAIRCAADGDVTVASAGPDGKLGTADDVVAE